MKTYFLLMCATTLHLILDMHKLKTNHPIRHWYSAFVASGVSLFLGCLNQLLTGVHWYQFMIYSLCIHFALFDYLWNFFNKKPFFYHGEPSNPKRAWTDKMWDRIPPWGEVFFRLWMLWSRHRRLSSLEFNCRKLNTRDGDTKQK